MSYDEIKFRVMRYFREFGDDVGEAVFTELCRPEGLPGLLQRMGIDPEGDSANQYKMLLQFLRYHGGEIIFKFIPPGARTVQPQPAAQPSPQMVMGQGQKSPSSQGVRPVTNDELSLSKVIQGLHDPEESPQQEQAPQVMEHVPIKKKKISEAPLPHLQKKREELEKANSPAVKEIKPHKVQLKKDSRDGAKSDDGYEFPTGPLKPGPPPTTTEGQEDWLPYDPSKPHDPDGEWPAVERRSGHERRKKADRRQSLEVVFKNRRYGGDRRSGEERRKNWPKNGYK